MKKLPFLFCSQCRNSLYMIYQFKKWLHCKPLCKYVEPSCRDAETCPKFLPHGPIAEAIRRQLDSRHEHKKRPP